MDESKVTIQEAIECAFAAAGCDPKEAGIEEFADDAVFYYQHNSKYLVKTIKSLSRNFRRQHYA